MKLIFLSDRQFKDLNPISLGYEECKPLKGCTDYPRDCVSLHYVYSGHGTLRVEDKAYNVGAGEAFIINEGERAAYFADGKDPWVYSWICFEGERCDAFRRLPSVFPHSPEIFREMLSVENTANNREAILASLLFMLYSEIQTDDRMTTEYIRKIMNIIGQNYMYDLRVERIAEELNLNRQYISALFKRETGKSILEYLIYVRMKEARRHLSDGRSVTETAGLVGYTESSNFSKMFKKHVGVSPIKYRRSTKLAAEWCRKKGSQEIELD